MLTYTLRVYMKQLQYTLLASTLLIAFSTHGMYYINKTNLIRVFQLQHNGSTRGLAVNANSFRVCNDTATTVMFADNGTNHTVQTAGNNSTGCTLEQDNNGIFSLSLVFQE